MESASTLYDSFECTQKRAMRQQLLIKQYHMPLISVKTLLPKELSQSPYNKEIFNLAIEAIQEKIKACGFKYVTRQIIQQKFGQEAFIVLDTRCSSDVKKQMMDIEQNHPLGALMDIDVADKMGTTISRNDCETSARKCLICGGPAYRCLKANKHSAEEIDTKIKTLLNQVQEAA